MLEVVMLGRMWLLTAGPLALIGVCYLVAAPWSSAARTAPRPLAVRLPPMPEETALESRCSATIAAYRALLPSDWNWRALPPFVLGSNVSVDELTRLETEILTPTLRALGISYFDRWPDEPVTILLGRDETAFQDIARRLGHTGKEEYAGLYSRGERRLLLNLETGAGTLAHELTHALSHADFPEMPQWFDEGLAALHEECTFASDGLQLLGERNWRAAALVAPLAQSRLPTLEAFVVTEFARDRAASEDYALARAVCLYLQERQVLSAFYRKCRANIAQDPTGGWALAQVLGVRELAEAEAPFRRWLGQRHLQTNDRGP